jgi:hypothetical protein
MREPEDSVIDVGALFEQVEAAAPIDAVEVVAAELGRMVDAHAVTFLIADFSGRAVVRLTSSSRVDGPGSSGPERAEALPLQGTRYERVLRTQQADVEAIGNGARMVVPVTDRGDAIGLLELDLPRYPSEDEIADISSAAHALGYVVIAARRHTDVFEWGQRSTPFELAAEIQRRLLPASYTCEAGQFTLAGWLEPASSVGGDTFDYTLDRDCLQVSITDAVGHQVAAALLATLLVGGLRNAASLDVAAALAASVDLHPREVVHELGAAVLHATGGDLRDDATMVCLDWYGGPPRPRTTEQGADPARASAAR